jgi:hypothetical protein
MNEPNFAGFFPGFDPYRSRSAPPIEVSPLSIPYDGQTRMRLTVASGMASARVRIDPSANALVTVHHDGAEPPALRVAGSEVRLSWPSWSLTNWLRGMFAGHPGGLEIVLHAAVAWELVVRGGLSSLEGELSAGTLTRIEVCGGCSDVELELPKPAQTVPIRISGGASQLYLRRPADVRVSVAVSGGIAALRLDDRTFEAIGGSARLETAGQVPESPGYEIVVSGGASNVEVDRVTLASEYP